MVDPNVNMFSYGQQKQWQWQQVDIVYGIVNEPWPICATRYFMFNYR